MSENKRVLVAMSGGVDSSVAVKLLLDKGYDVAGATMRLYSNEDIGLEKGTSDVDDARNAALKLGIDFHVFDFSSEFRKCVIDSFIETYLSGGTPNPCIECNKHLKFGKFLERAKQLGYDYAATGHYVERVYDEQSKLWRLKRSHDSAKDQSYVLYSLTQEQLAHTLFPVAGLSKSDIRKIAEDNSLVNASKPDSQDICFIPDGDYAKFITDNAGEQQHGKIVLTDGMVVGEHKGLINYTIGQRKGIGVSYSEPLFVVDKNMSENTLVLGTKNEIGCKCLIAEKVNYISSKTPLQPFECTAQTRYHQKDKPCTVYPLENSRARVEFHEPQKAISKGQSVVFYDGDFVLGGGIICETLK